MREQTLSHVTASWVRGRGGKLSHVTALGKLWVKTVYSLTAQGPLNIVKIVYSLTAWAPLNMVKVVYYPSAWAPLNMVKLVYALTAWAPLNRIKIVYFSFPQKK